MKKLLAIILVVLMSVSILFVTACEKNQGENSSETRQSSSEEESSTRRRGDTVDNSGEGNNGGNTGNDNPGNNTGNDNTNNSGNNGNNGNNGGNTGNNGGNTGNNGGNNFQPTTGSYVYGNYPYSYTTNVTTVTFDLTLPYTFVDTYIIDLPAPTLNGTFYDSLVDAEDSYNALSASDKGMVANYARLQEARTAYDDMAKQEAISLINELIDPSMDNLTTFANAENKIKNLLNKMTSTSGVSNLSTYNSKVQNSQSIIVSAFNDAVSQIATFEYSNDYKAKLDNASSIYQIVLNANLQGQVTSQKTTLDNRVADWSNRVIAGGLEDILAQLPGVNNITENDKATLKALRKSYRMLTDAQKAILPAETTNLYNAYVDKAQSLWPEYICYTPSGAGGDSYFKVVKSNDSSSTLGGTDRGSSCPGLFEGETLTSASKFKPDRYIKFTTTGATILTIIANCKDDEAGGTITASLNGSAVGTATVTYQSPENTEYQISLPNAGTYTLSSSSDSVLLFALCVN